MNDVLKTVCDDFESELVEFDGEQGHVHRLVNYPPKVSISKLVNSLKGGSSRMLRKEFPELSNTSIKAFYGPQAISLLHAAVLRFP